MLRMQTCAQYMVPSTSQRQQRRVCCSATRAVVDCSECIEALNYTLFVCARAHEMCRTACAGRDGLCAARVGTQRIAVEVGKYPAVVKLCDGCVCVCGAIMMDALARDTTRRVVVVVIYVAIFAATYAIKRT